MGRSQTQGEEHMTKDEALKLARTALGVQLDALLGKAGHLRNDDRKRYAENGIKAIDEALAEPEQEPVAWRWGIPKLKNGDFEWRYSLNQTRPDAIPLYTTPPQRKPLTDEEVNKLVDDEDWYNDPHGFVRAIEAAHGIKGEA
jgi:hypothetical protein